ncbi:MAG TPA: SpoIIE family protein phosphatase [Thermoanaerobaculaceae bacterium]|nr:SpoIIE family protein phosphatase [Thermoanaerobaculaceae bacterium]HRS14864.1 SpoIIE family protein phosphatase [Thermoanaerobaculaceae bacterium]
MTSRRQTGGRAQAVDLEARVQRLEAVVEASALVNSTLDLRTIGETIVGIATRLIGAERGSLFLLDARQGVLRSLVAHGVDGLLVRVGEGIVGTVAAEGQPLVLDDPYGDPRFDRRFDTATGFVTRSLLTVPVRDRNGQLVAVLQLLNHRGGRFRRGDVEFLAELGVPFAVALATARLHEEIVLREKLAEEVRVASTIQQGLHPRNLAAPGLELAAHFQPCRGVGGDYYDLIPARYGRTWLVLADVSGKGIPAALIASHVQSFLWSRRLDRRPLERIAAEGNELLHRFTQGKKYATVVLAEWNPRRRTLTYVNAGHPPVLVRRGGTVEQLGSTGAPLGLMPGLPLRSATTALAPGDLVLLYTDGVNEAGAELDIEEFGVERIAAVLHDAASPRELLCVVSATLASYLGEHAPHDDVTMLAARCLAGAAAS